MKGICKTMRKNGASGIFVLVSGAVALCAAMCFGATPAVTPFAAGERVTFLGDSITHGGLYHANLQLFWDLRFPGSGTRLMNCGVSGGTAGGGVKRWKNDVLPQKADRVFVMFGMNDVGHGGYKPGAKLTEKVLAARKASLTEYRKKMTQIADDAQAAGMKLVVMTPTPYDEYGSRYTAEQRIGCNSIGLASLADFCRSLAAERKAELLELYAPLTKFIEGQRDYMFCRVDRVHPTPVGHIIVMARILEAMGVSPVVAEVEVGADGRVAKSVRAEVSDVKPSSRGISFRYAPETLPFPASDDYVHADLVYPVSEKMNLEKLKIAGMAPGDYALMADGAFLGRFSADRLAKGVNLAVLPTPAAKLAMEAWKISRELATIQSRQRTLVQMEAIAQNRGANMDDFNDVCAKIDEFVKDLKKRGGSTANYYAVQQATYIREKPKQPQLREQEDDCRRRLAEAAAKKASYVLMLRPAPLIQAHRGSRGEYDDNAAGGFAWCVKNGIRGFETDIRFSKDHRPVIMHDSKANRTTDGTGIIEEMTYSELKQCRLQACSEPIPDMIEVLAPLRGRKDTFIELEMKAYPTNPFYTPETLEDYCRKIWATAKACLEPGTYAFTCFNTNTLAMMRRVHPDAKLGYIMGEGLADGHIATAKALGCMSVAPLLKKTTKEMVDKAHAAGLTVCLWMVQNAADYAEAAEKGADRVTSDYPHLLTRAVERRCKKLVAMDLDATLCQHRSPIPPKNMVALKELEKQYRCIMVGAGNAPRIYKQMGNHPIDIVANYGMQVAEAANGPFRIVKAVTNTVDRAFFREKTDYLRNKYGYTQYEGEPLEFHASGMVTFGLLGTKPTAEHKVTFDPDRRKRRAMYPEVVEIFKDYSVYIGGSTSFDFAGKEYNKYNATLTWAKDHGYELDDIVFIGDDFADGGGDSHVRIKGMDRIVITDYKNFAEAVSVLLR